MKGIRKYGPAVARLYREANLAVRFEDYRMLREMIWLRKRCSPRQPVDSSQYYQQGPAYQNSPELLNEPVHVPTASHGCQEKNTNNDQQGQNRAGMLPTSFKYLRRVVNQSDSTLSIRQPTYTKRRNPARTELQANLARTVILLVRNGFYHCHRSRQTAAATINSSQGFPAAGDQRHAYVQVAALRRRRGQHVVAAQVFRDVGLPDRIDDNTTLEKSEQRHGRRSPV
ncbi:uncharacterized protein LOC120417354 isoform X1 [Culex pipiens pallens]|uniref:uncharacterized protein LOC120417354 isoform X1 n=2 Tax=Culex pipiens pallens TaxID=42434 RepID=UPI0022AA4F21|nr:uncharacterized protein LOC120417354 isoform X1 [Culex pipiens pallens]XP_052563462.1 uncharacterized protein LOC120417354 isoform X1 [Culex pipiens pallens]